MKETAMLINRSEVSWACWEYLCMKCGVDSFKTRELVLYVTRAKGEGNERPGEVE